MSLSDVTFVSWLALTVLPLWVAMLLAFVRIRACANTRSDEPHPPALPLEVFVPVKGTFPDQERVLNSLLEQSYPCYSVSFILESADDAAYPVVESLCRRHRHAGRIISGVSLSCAQKNHNLVEGTRSLKPETQILLFCDSTNEAHPHWMERLTVPLRKGTSEVVTTFRTFNPRPATVAGVCQAMYAAFLVLLQVNKPTPWGGATAIRRETFDRLRVREAWSNTVVDDLILGNVLERAGVPLVVDAAALLESPLQGQTVKGFLSYLDRQVLFPKFTNPGMWGQSLFFVVNCTSAVLFTTVQGILCAAGRGDTVTAWLSYGFLASMVIFVWVLRRISPVSITLSRWMIAFFPCLLLSAYVFVRSVLRNHIDWHGRRYWPGKNGVVKEAHFLRGNPR